MTKDVSITLTIALNVTERVHFQKNELGELKVLKVTELNVECSRQHSSI